MIKDSPRISVVINTCNRGAYLADTLRGLQQQLYDNFEVVLVNGPSIDNTEEVAKQFNVRYYTAPFNISVSRNVGIKHAAGDILAFIDDDAVPEPEWLRDLVKAYNDPKVAAAGGRVFNADGSDYQYSYGAIDAWGYPISRHDKPYDFNDPKGTFFNINIGTNASYRREPLIEVGGFDEEIEYYHDESDVCVRLIEAGYKVAQLDDAYVHHKMAPSFRRKNAKRVTVWDAIVKNTIYYGIKHTKDKKANWKRFIRPAMTERQKFNAPFALMREGEFTFPEAMTRYFSLHRAVARGYYRGYFQKRKLLKDYSYEPEKFKKFKESEMKDKLNIVLVNQGYPPEQTDGNSRHNGVLAEELASRGHNVYVVARAEGGKHKTIEFRNGVWLYRHQPKKLVRAVTGHGRVDDQLAHAKSVYYTVKEIKDKHGIDAILVPVWDVEGLAILKHKLAPTILSLMSPLKKVVETQWFGVDEPSYEITYDFERFCVLNADAVMPISDNIKQTIGDLYDINWKKVETRVPVRMIPLGVNDQFIGEKAKKKSDEVRLLYVGRFERRKGIDLLFKALSALMEKHKNLHVDLIGDKTLVDENGVNYFAEFEAKYKKEAWFKRLYVPGFVSEKELADKYKECDVFVAPSRYESFGQIYIEAMASGKPVIGSKTGGIPEVVEDGVNGLLIVNEDADDLQKKLDTLISDEKLRDKMGAESRRIIEKKFSSKVWGDAFLQLVNDISKK